MKRALGRQSAFGAQQGMSPARERRPGCKPWRSVLRPSLPTSELRLQTGGPGTVARDVSYFICGGFVFVFVFETDSVSIFLQ